jgi:site-specific recombinase XerD
MYGKRYRINTHCKCYPEQWNNGKPYSFTQEDIYNNDIVTEKINEANEKINQLNEYLCNDITLSAKDGDNVVKMFFNYKPMNKNINKSIIDVLYSTNDSMHPNHDAVSSWKTYDRTITNFYEYVKQNEIDDNISQPLGDIIKGYKEWCIKNNNKISSINNKLGQIRALLRKYGKDKSNNFNYFDSGIEEAERYSTKKDERISKDRYVTLWPTEIEALYNTQIELSVKQREVVDMFVFLCLTGLRIEDLKTALSPSTKQKVISGITYLHVYIQKNGTYAEVPLFSEISKEIYNKYLGKEISTTIINQYIKKICKRIGGMWLDKVSFRRETPTGVKSCTDVRWHLIHCHTGRHTFITNCCRAGILEEEVILMTGHTDVKMIHNIYNNMNRDERLEKISPKLMGHTENKEQQPQGGDGIAIMADKVAELAASNATLQQGNKALQEDNDTLKDNNKQLQDSNTILEQGNKVLQEDNDTLKDNNADLDLYKFKRELDDRIEGYEDDPQELEKDRIEGVLNKLLDAKQITAEQYERALKDPDYCYQLEAKFKGI